MSYPDSWTELVIDPLCQLKWRQTQPTVGVRWKWNVLNQVDSWLASIAHWPVETFAWQRPNVFQSEAKKMERVSLFASSISENIDIDWSAHHLFFLPRCLLDDDVTARNAREGGGLQLLNIRKKYLCCAQRQRLLAIVERYRSGHTATDFHIIIKCPSVAIRRSAGPPGPKIVAGNFSTSLTFSVEKKNSLKM